MSTPREQLDAALAGRYAIERELGRGGMATVYLADDLRHGRKVAIKVLHPELAAVLGAERFLAEIRVTASLQHPHILGLIDSGSAGGAGSAVVQAAMGPPGGGDHHQLARARDRRTAAGAGSTAPSARSGRYLCGVISASNGG